MSSIITVKDACLLTGSVRLILPLLDAGSVQMCVTSPPYYGLRDYGTAKWEGGDPACDHGVTRWEGEKQTQGAQSGHAAKNDMLSKRECACGARRIDEQIGLESTPQAYVDSLVAVFREVRRGLRDDGTLWLNLGDSYTANRSYQVNSTKGGPKHGPGQGVGGKGSEVPEGLKPKDLIGIPWRVAFALQADGWYLRQDIIWAKPNPMPESVTDRCTKSHEYIFMLTKSAKYYYDAAAIAEPLQSVSVKRMGRADKREKPGFAEAYHGNPPGGFTRENVNKQTYDGSDRPYTGKATKDYATAGAQDASATKARIVDRILSGEITTRNKRDVWTVTTKPCKDAHFATFPPDLIEPCILAGAPAGGVVLDPFSGAGTTCMVANRHGRQSIGIELNPAYTAIAVKRLTEDLAKPKDGR